MFGLGTVVMPSPRGRKKSPKTGGGNAKSSPARGAAKGSKSKSKSKGKKKAPEEEPLPPDADIVLRVSRMMKTNKLSQVQVGQEARVSQAVISQWLARKYAFTPCSLQHTHRSGTRTGFS